MDIRPACSSCTGADKCSKYCVVRAGSNLINFINSIDVVETQIGELKDNGNKKKGLMVLGHVIESGGNPTYILSDVTTSVDISGKFKSSCDISILDIIKGYLNSLNLDKEKYDENINMFKRINSNKLVPVPLKPGVECEITYTDSSGNKVATMCKIKMVQWSTDRTTSKLNCDIYCSIDAGFTETKYIKIPITEYGKRIRLPHIERTLKSSEVDREILEMTHSGIIKPIVVSDDKNVVAVDGTYVYKISDNNVVIVGMWKNGAIEDVQDGMESISRTKAYKRIKNAMSYIDRHRRFIAPLGLMESNKLKA